MKQRILFKRTGIIVMVFLLQIQIQAAEGAHCGQPVDRFGGPQENRCGAFGDRANDVDASVDAVASIGVEPSGRSEHRLVARCRTSMSVGGGITPVSEVSLDLDDSNDEALVGLEAVDEATSDQLSSDDAAVSGIERPAKGATKGHPSSIPKAQRECLRLGTG